MLVQLYILAGGKGRVAVRREHLRLDPAVLARMVRLSGGAVVQSLIATSSWVGLIRILASFGSDALAGYTIAIRVVVFALLPSWGLANAAATLVGQNLGADRPERAEASVWRACFYNLLFLGGVGLIFVLLADTVVSGFTSDPGVAPVAVQGLRIIAGGFVFYAYGFVLTQAFNGAGDTLTPTAINIACFWLFEIPLAYLLAQRVGLGSSGVFWAVAIAFSSVAVVSGILFRRGAWKLKRV